MLNSKVASFLLASTTFACPAFAADLPSRKAPPVVPTMAEGWSGLYVGAHAGYGFARTDFSALGLGLAGLGSNGGTVGGVIGFDWQFAQRFVAGVAVDGDLSGVDSSLAIGPINVTAKANDTLAARVRAGYLASPSTLVYLTGGIAQARTKIELGALAAANQTFNGGVVGAGIETRLSGNWFLNAEYLHYFLNGKNFLGGVLRATPEMGVARVGVSYKFGSLVTANSFPPPETPARASWTGFHVGVQGGLGWSNTTYAVPLLASLRGIGSKGVTAGLIGGYDQQVSPQWVIGAEADVSVADTRASINLGAQTVEGKSAWNAGLRARAGHLFGSSTLPFIAVGYGWEDRKISATGILNRDFTFGGLQISAGVETLITSNISARIEYVHTFYQAKTVFAPLTFKPESGKVMFGVSYKFGGDAAPVVAKY
jgi:outer membrane immunogenic protein